jgi:hypothetical protein
MTALTLPLPVLLVSLLGGLRLGAPLATRLFSRLSIWLPAIPAPAARLGVLAALMVVTQLGAVSLPNVPMYGGVKLFLPAFPFIAVLAGLGFGPLEGERVRAALPRWVLPLTAAVVLLPGIAGIAAYRGAWLSYYTEYIGGLRGATEAGLERQYYDLAYPELAQALRQALPSGGRVAVLPNPKEYVPYFARWEKSGELPRGIRLVPPEQAEVVVLTHERRWASYPELMARYRTRRVLSRLERASVPLFTMYDGSVTVTE